MMEKALHELERLYEGRLVIGKINVDEEARLMETHAVTAIPTLIAYWDGQIVARRVGAQSKDQLDKLVKELLSLLSLRPAGGGGT
jgi:thioredoxin 1